MLSRAWRSIQRLQQQLHSPLRGCLAAPTAAAPTAAATTAAASGARQCANMADRGSLGPRGECLGRVHAVLTLHAAVERVRRVI